MRPISVLNVEGRIFFSVVHKRLANFLIGNSYIDTKNQKGFIQDMAGCIEQGALVEAALRYTKRHKRPICIPWLDLANAFGSVSHTLVKFPLDWFHVPASICTLIFNYYESIFSYV